MKDFLILIAVSIVSSILGSITGVLICSQGQGCPIGEKRKLKCWMRKVKEEVTLRKSKDSPAGDALTPVDGIELDRSRRYLRR